MREFYYIACQIERGAFTNERTFEVPLSANVTYEGSSDGKLVGTAHFDYLRDKNKKPLGDEEPSYGETIEGFVVCRRIRELGKGFLLVELPSADVIHVAESSLIQED
jgi:hypothetical protein